MAGEYKMKKNLILSLIIGDLILVFSSHLPAVDWDSS
jgi:hypothetical protein